MSTYTGRCKHDHRKALEHDYDAGNRCRCCGINFGQIGGSGNCPGPVSVVSPADQKEQQQCRREWVGVHDIADDPCRCTPRCPVSPADQENQK